MWGHNKARGHRGRGNCDFGGRDFGGGDFAKAAFARMAMGRGGGFGDAFGFGGGRGGGFFGGGHGGGGGGRRRVFDAEQLQLVLLALIAEQPRHGYELIKEIEARSGGTYAPSPGVVYPTLTMLDEMGHVDELKEEGARRRFAITDAGREALAAKQGEADALLARLADLAESQSDRAPLRRAMMNLHMAVRQSMMGGRGEEDRAHDIAAILDDAARQIERL